MTDIRWTDETYHQVLEILGARTGLTFRADQRRSTEEGIEYAMRRAGVTEPDEFARLLTYDIDALEDLILKLTVGETYFFREKSHFEALRQKILPELRRRRGPEYVIRIWSVGCASGEEPYSLAMTCDQAGFGDGCEILATDISSEAIGKARRGVYRAWSLRGEGAQQASPYLRPFGEDQFQVHPRLRDRIRFEFLNLAMDVYPSAVTGTRGVDVIFCRNVLIYFSKATIEQVAARLAQCLNDGGWLVTASSDPPLGNFGTLESVVTEYGVFYQRKHPTPLPPFDSPIQRGQSETSSISPKRPGRPLRVESSRVVRADQSISPTHAKAFANDALERGDYQAAKVLTADLAEQDPEAAVLYIKALGNIDTKLAIARCDALAKEFPLQAELHHLSAVLLMEQNLDVEAIQAAQRAVYVDPSLAMAHFLLGSILRRRGSLDAALRSFHNALRICENAAPNSVVPLTEDELASDFARMARQQVNEVQRVIGRMR